MEISISLRIPKKELPSDYRPTIINLFQAVLSRYSLNAYQPWNRTQNHFQKGLTFAVKFENPVFTDEKMNFENENVRLDISSANEYRTMLLYKAFRKSTGYSYPYHDDGQIIIESVKLFPQPRIVYAPATIKFVSPLVVRYHITGIPDRYFIYNDIEFHACLTKILENQLGCATDIHLEPISPRKTVVRAFGTKIRCSIGTYRISGNPMAIDVLSKSGIGSRCGDGFGYFKLM